MALVYNIESILNLDNINANLNAETERNIANGDVELAFAGVGNFLTGNFKQDSSDINDIQSNVEVTNGLQKSRLFLMANGPEAGMASVYGNSLLSAGYETKYGSGAIKLADSNSSPVDANSVVPGGSGTIIPLTEQSFTDDTWAHNAGSFGEGLVNAVGAALFKKVGKNAALINDTDMVSSIDSSIQSVLGGAMNESGKDYANSKYFKRYLESGRYAGQSNGELNAVVSYDMNNTLIKMKIKMSGTVRDTNGDVDLTDSATINQVFGATSATPDVSNASTPHLVDTSGNYSIHVYLELRHDERF